jgi:lipid A 3-O-deacylase
MKAKVAFVLTVSTALALTAGAAHAEGVAPDSVSLEYGTGNDTRIARAGMQWDWDRTWFDSNGTHVGGYWDLTLAQWQGRAWDGIDGHDHNDTDIGITPVFRFENDSKVGWYSELGIGAHLMTSIYDNNHRDFSTAFQFGDHIGVGYETKNWSVGIKLQHFSNGGIKHPNPGANFAVFGVDFKL